LRGKLLAGRLLALTSVVAAAGVSVVLLAAAPSALAGPLDPPGEPTGVIATAQNQGAVVSWMPPSSDGGSPVTGYVITASPGGMTVQTSAVRSYQVGGLVNGTAYTFTVAAVNSSGQGPASDPSSAVTPQAATTPGRTRLVTAVAGFQQVSVSWAPPASDGNAPITAYRLTTSPFTRTVSVAGNARSATLTRLSDGTAYRVLVAAVNGAGRGKPGRSAGVTPEVTVPTAPVGVTAAPVSSGVEVSWQPPLSNGGSTVTGYVVTVTGTTQTITAGASGSSVTVTGLTAGTAYTFQVAATNAQGQGPAEASPPATDGGTAGSATVVLTAASLAALSQVGTDGTLMFTNAPAQVQNLAAGDIVVAGVSAATPDGLLAKVTSVSAAGAIVTVATVPASLDDALSGAGFGADATLTPGQVAQFVPARPGVRLLAPGQAPASAAPGSVSLSLDTTLYKSADGRTVSVAGSASLSPSVSFAASISCCVHTASQFTGSVTASASLSFNAQVSHDVSGGYTLGTFHFTPITFDVLGVPVVIVPVLTVKLTAEGSVTAGLTAGAGESVTVGAQVNTQDGQVSAHPFSSRTTAPTPLTLYGSLSAAGGVQAALSATVDGVAGATLTDQLWLAKLSADPSKTPWWKLSLENQVTVDLNLTLLDHSFAEYHKTLSDVTVRLAQASSPYQGVTISPDPASVPPGGTLQLSAQVAGTEDQGVTWNAPAGNGTVTTGGLYTAPGTPGVYQVTAAQPASGLNPGAVGLISIQVGDQPPGPPTSPAATSTNYGAATVTWAPPSDTGGGTITGYTITAQPGGAAYAVPGTVTSDAVDGLTPDASYTFTVTAATDGGTSLPSPATDPVEISNVGGSGGDWTVAEAPLPPGASSNPSPDLGAIACSSASDCVAVGTYQTPANQQGLLVTGSGSSWAATTAPLPANAGNVPGQEAALQAVACPPPASPCAAVGDYHDSSGNYEGLLVTGSDTSWTGIEAPLPADAVTTNQNSGLQAVACPSSDSCIATGYYTNSSGGQGMLLTGSGTSWTATRAPVPANAAASPDISLQGVACASATSCVATGRYNDSSGNQQGLLLTGSGTSWTATEAPLPPDAAADPYALLHTVTCPDTDSCSAVNNYHDTSGNGQGLLVTGAGTSWTATEAPLPPGASTSQNVALLSVACPSDTSCVVGGYYLDSSFTYQGLLLTGSGSSWTATEEPLPANAETSQGTFGVSVACPASASCVATGSYTDSAGNAQGLWLTGSGTSWSAAEAPLPANASANQEAGLGEVACPDSTSCIATGSYVDSSATGQGLLITGPG
jgi:Fibronectin type III domain